ncbi:MAG: hypothetical protein Q7S87_09245 [Agitococcus sp.]|nr:hypothetical protein [Agitococcus sp.]MDO9177557.1 hypothetical protein [Agitococcus sp.]
MSKKYIKNGFTFYSDNTVGRWYWFFCPIDETIEVRYKGNRGELLFLLDSPEEALTYYLKKLDAMVDVAKAEELLLQAEQYHQSMHDPSFDPGGSTNNPGAVARAHQEAGQSHTSIARARRSLLVAKSFKARAEAAPFDINRWKTLYLAAPG